MGGSGSGRKPKYFDPEHIRVREAMREMRLLKKHPSLSLEVKKLEQLNNQ